MKRISYILLLVNQLYCYGQIPTGYYSSVEGRIGSSLKAGLNDLISEHTVYPYSSSSTDTWDILKVADQDPTNSSNVIGVYSGFSMDGAAEYANGSGWSREHIWAKSRGAFDTNETAGTDCHNLRAEDVSTNSARSNRSFDECDEPYVDVAGNYSGPTNSFTSSSSFVWEPRDDVKGDVARIIFYMATRYEGENGEPDLEVTEEILENEDQSPLHGRLSTLLDWHLEDPVSQAERDRNDIIHSYQNNRNPFIDHPEYVELIWNTNGLILGLHKAHSRVIYSGNTKTISINGNPNDVLSILSITGQLVMKAHVYGIDEVSVSRLQGLYIVYLQNGKDVVSTKIMIE